MISNTNNDLIDQHINNIDKIILDNIFNNYDFNDRLKSFITYSYYTKDRERMVVEPTEEKIDEFRESIFKEIYLSVLIKLRDSITYKKSIKNKLDKDINIKLKYDETFFLNEKQLLDLFKKYCNNDVYLSLFKKIQDEYDFKEIFYKDNSLYNIVAFNCFKDTIINEVFNINNPTYKIEINVKNKLLTKLKTISTYKMDNFIMIYNEFKNLLFEKKIDENYYINKWISFYEINKKNKYINIAVVARYLSEYEELGFEREINLLKDYVISFNKYISNLEDHIKNNDDTEKIKEYRMELVAYKISYKHYKEKLDKQEKKYKDKLKYRRCAKETLLSNRLFIINFLINNIDVLDDLYYNDQWEKIDFLKNLFDKIDNISIEVFQYIKKKKSLIFELSLIETLNKYLRDIEHKKLFEVDFDRLVKSNQFMELYDIVNR